MSNLWFGAYVLWLTAFAMSGPLMEPAARLAWFALPHALALLAWGRWGDSRRLEAVMPLALLLTAGATAGQAVMPAGAEGGAASWMAALLGLAAAPVSLRAGEWLALQRRPVVAAAVGLALGNAGSVALVAAPVPRALKLALLTILLMGFALPRRTDVQRLTSRAGTPWRSWVPLLLFLTAFQVVSGLMYSHLWPAYRQHAPAEGLELLFYMASVALVTRWTTAASLGCTLTAVLLSLASFSVYVTLAPPWGPSGAMFLMMMATGIVDLLLLALVLRQGHVVRAYGYGVGALVLGIAIGDLLSSLLPAAALPTGFSALGALILSMVALTAWRFGGAHGLGEPVPALPAFAQADGDAGTCPAAVPATPGSPDASQTHSPVLAPQWAALLSEQEQRVVLECATGAPYREIAHTLGISESSVKTYMQRSFRKLGIYRRVQLAPLLARPPTRLPPGDEGP